jgi:predicted RecA/RadA family phage recombinase
MASFLHEGRSIDYTPSGSSLSAGDVVVVGDFIGVAADDIADGQTGALLVEGVFKMPAPGDTAFSAGDTVDWDGSTIIATAGSPVGKVVKDCATADTIAWVKLTP